MLCISSRTSFANLELLVVTEGPASTENYDHSLIGSWLLDHGIEPTPQCSFRARDEFHY
jgi:hypothetical protein